MSKRKPKKSNKEIWNEISKDPQKLYYFRQNFVKNGLRRLSYRWFGRFNALNASKLDRNEYVCNSCGTINPKRNIQLDHVLPVIPVTSGWDTFDGFIERLFCIEAGYQVLCRDCHLEKSLSENTNRDRKRKK